MVPSEALSVLPSTWMLFTAWMALRASSALWYVTYADALGPCQLGASCILHCIIMVITVHSWHHANAFNKITLITGSI